jgi:hypothetical protein
VKRYLLFAGIEYYADGGWAEFVDSYDNVETAATEGKRRRQISQTDDGDYEALNLRADWYHVVDTNTGVVVCYEGHQIYGGIEN